MEPRDTLETQSQDRGHGMHWAAPEDETSREHADEKQNRAPGPSSAQRAYIAHAAPHLLDQDMLSHDASSSATQASSPVASTPQSPAAAAAAAVPLLAPSSASFKSESSSARPSPSPSEDDAARTLEGQSRNTPPVGGKKSHHSVPRGYRGPVPLQGDAEEIAPVPSLAHVPGFSSDACNVVNYPINRNGWRYTAAGPASHLLPFGIYRTLETEPRGVHWSWSDRSPYTHISPDASTVSADGGFRSARANIPVRSGSWFAEIHILAPESGTSRSCSDSAHARVGWARREAALNAPVGCNGYSYGLRDTSGEKVFLARTYPYAKPFGVGDVIGMWISLPAERQPNANDRSDPARIQRKRLPIRYKGRLYFESLEYAPTKEMDHLMSRSRRGEKLGPLANQAETAINPNSGLIASVQSSGVNGTDSRKKGKGTNGPPGAGQSKPTASNLRSLPTLGPESKIGFFINGEPQGIAFENLLDYRTLARHKDTSRLKNKKVAAGPTLHGHDENDGDVITASSTAASILKSRENHYDDGALGYFPFVSLYGGARARLVTRADDFSFPPPENVAQALYAANSPTIRDAGSLLDLHETGPTRPLDDRFDEYMEEMLRFDLADEEMWRAIVLKRRAEEEDDDDDRDLSPARAVKKSATKRKSGASSSQNTSAAAASSLANPALKIRSDSTPLRDDKSVLNMTSATLAHGKWEGAEVGSLDKESTASTPVPVKSEHSDEFDHDQISDAEAPSTIASTGHRPEEDIIADQKADQTMAMDVDAATL